ncbi:hypothetical protein [Pseudomonas mandelii]|uniref:Uncharacterized protein n=1 Tax=Pseudomonas mandelii TaxID=75612 RepID=A0AB36CW74_9PSED|nr:hypothetical protein [Pseudomonas mandelii]NMZ79921.1 hypothetical protein [Pseudomonas mandelii]
MDRKALKEKLKNLSHAQNSKGELKVSMDDNRINYPADSIEPPDSTFLIFYFGKRESSGALENGIGFLIRRTATGKEITFPGNGGSTVVLIDNDEYYSPKNGTLTVNYDEGQNLAWGSFNIVMETDSNTIELKDGIFSIHEIK